MLFRLATPFLSVVAVLIPISCPKALDVSDPVSSIVEDIKRNISFLIQQLDNNVSARSFQLRSELVFLLGEVEHSSLTLVDKTFGQLNNSQQLFFENTAKSIASARENFDGGADKVSLLVENVEHIMAMVPFSSKEPRVRNTVPQFLETTTLNDQGEVKVAVEGSFLNHGGATFILRDQPCRIIDHKENRIEFACQKRLFNFETGIEYMTGLLTVDDDVTFWDGVKNVFGNYEPKKQYAISITVVPKKIGHYSVTATSLVDDVLTFTNSGSWGFTNQHCQGETHMQYNFGPHEPGWAIDTASIQPSLTCSRWGNFAVRNVSSAGFQLESWATNSGQCAKLFGKIVSYDARGCQEGTVRWLENAVRPRDDTQKIAEGDLFWSKDEPIPLPPRLQSFIITVSQFNGQQIVLNTAGPAKWFSVDRDATSASLVVKPKPLQVAMQGN